MRTTDTNSMNNLKQSIFYGLCFMSILVTSAQAQQESWHEEPAQYCKFNKNHECIKINTSKYNKVCGSPESEDFCYDITPPPKSAIRREQNRLHNTPQSLVRPQHWPFRAVYIGKLGALEFDEKGNVINAEGTGLRPGFYTGVYVAEIYFIKDNYALWEDDRYKVYYLFKPSDDDPRYTLSGTQGFVVSKDFKRLCPTVEIASDYSSIKNDGLYLYLRGDCDQAKQVEYKGGTYWTYPRNPYFRWAVQRFEDPKEPIYDSYFEKCLLYCAPD